MLVSRYNMAVIIFSLVFRRNVVILSWSQCLSISVNVSVFMIVMLLSGEIMHPVRVLEFCIYL